MSAIQPTNPYTPLYEPKTAAASSNPVTTPAIPPNTTPQDTADLSLAGLREILQNGRISLNEQAGRLTADQATQLQQQEQALESLITSDQQSNGGPLTTSQALQINHLQNNLSHEIWAEANGYTPNGVTGTAPAPTADPDAH